MKTTTSLGRADYAPQIKTDNILRRLVALQDLPNQIQNEFEYAQETPEAPRFVQFKGHWYDAFDAVPIVTTPHPWGVQVDPQSNLAQWSMVLSETYFSGVLFRHLEDEVVCGSYFG